MIWGSRAKPFQRSNLRRSSHGPIAPPFWLWIGFSVHEIAQAVAASFQQGQIAGEMGTKPSTRNDMSCFDFGLATFRNQTLPERAYFP
jgi:hypothetical protein